jgi:hypothetical protein
VAARQEGRLEYPVSVLVVHPLVTTVDPVQVDLQDSVDLAVLQLDIRVVPVQELLQVYAEAEAPLRDIMAALQQAVLPPDSVFPVLVPVLVQVPQGVAADQTSTVHFDFFVPTHRMAALVSMKPQPVSPAQQIPTLPDSEHLDLDGQVSVGQG